MSVKSKLGRGLIYAGETPLVCTITVEQTGPMQLTVRAGSFMTTGQARIVDASRVPNLAALIAAGKAEMMPDGVRVRVWLQKPDGALVEKSQMFTLVADAVFNLTSDPVDAKAYRAELGVQAGVVDVLMRSQFAQDTYPDAPAGWKKVHDLIFEFTVPPRTTDLSGIDIFVLTVVPGFPPGTTEADWLSQSGSV